MFLLKYILLISVGLALVSCASSKQVKQLKADNAKLAAKVDSLSKELAAKTAALSLAQKTIAQLSEKARKNASARKKIDLEDQERVPMFIHNITKYVQWQKNDPANYFVVGVVGDDEMFDRIAAQFNGKKIADKPVLVKQMNTSLELEKANLYYISSSRLNLLSEVRKKADKSNSLILSDAHQPIDGIHINFFNENDSLHFDMNEEEIKKSNLIISSALKNLQK